MDRMSLTRHGRRAVAAVGALAALSLFSAGPAAADSGCARVASPAGSDSAAGTEAAPYASVQKLVEALGPGETGCLRQGAYGGDHVFMNQPDSTLKSFPGERATVRAFLEVYPEAARARVSGIRFDSADNGNDSAVKLNADDVVFSDNEVTKGAHGICVLAGSWHPAHGVVIERNRIHDCGPAGSKYDHDIYLSGTQDAVVRWNILSADAGGFGVHMYPNADGTVVEHNIIDGNHGGVVFGGDGEGQASDHNTVRNNAVTFSGPRWNIESSWSDGPAGVDNRAIDNCVYSTGGSGRSGVTQDGFNAGGNVTLAGSPYVDRTHGDYRFRADSPCLGLVGDVEGTISGRPSSPPQPRVEVLLARPTATPASVPVAQPAQTVVLSGRVKGRRRVRRVALQMRGRRGWRLVKVRRVGRHGKFTARIRVRRSRRARTLRLRAVVPNVASSRTVRVRVRP
jgi:hypothetical protein